MVLYICKKFHNILNSFQLTERTQVNGKNGYVQCSITSKIGKPELRFRCSASRLIVLYICVKILENIDRTLEHSRNGYFQYLLCSKGCNSKSRLTRVTFFVFYTLSHVALHL